MLPCRSWAHPSKLATGAVGRDSRDVVEALRSFARGESPPHLKYGAQAIDREPRVAFVFSGQGTQWAGMGSALLAHEPVFRDKLVRIDGLLRDQAGWSLLEELAAVGTASRLGQTAVAQPAIFAIQVAMAEQLLAWGVEPSAVVGHSVGEVAAAHVAGMLSLEDAVRVVYHRGRLMQGATGRGKMAVAEVTEPEAQSLLAAFDQRVSIAAINSPRSLTLSGEERALEEIGAALERRGRFFQRLDVDYAFHSPQMEPYQQELDLALDGIRPRPAVRAIYSTVQGGPAGEADFGPAYWARNIRLPVRFSAAIAEMAQAGCNTFVELGPHPALASAVRQCMEGKFEDRAVVTTLRRNGDGAVELLAALATLYVRGCHPNWTSVYPGTRKHITLPSYPWQRRRFSVEGKPAGGPKATPDTEPQGQRGHSLLGRHTQPAPHVGTHFFETEVDLDRLPWAADHRVGSKAVFPAAGYVLMALKAAAKALGTAGAELKDVQFSEALFLNAHEPQSLQLAIVPDRGGESEFQVHGRPFGESGDGIAWRRHASGKIAVERRNGQALVPPTLRAFQDASRACISADEHYRTLEGRQLHYGPRFREIESLWLKDTETLARIQPAGETGSDDTEFIIHPATLDAALQALVTLVPNATREESDAVWLPVGLETARLGERPASREPLWAWAIARPAPSDERSFSGDVVLLTEDGRIVCEARGVRLKRLEHAPVEDIGDWLFEVEWHPRPLAQSETAGETLAPRSLSEITRRLHPLTLSAASLGDRDLARALVPELDSLGVQFILQALRDLSTEPTARRSFTLDDLMQELEVSDQHRRLLGRMLEILAHDGHLRKVGDRWEVCRETALEAPVTQCAELRVRHPECAAELELFSRCGENLARALRGELNPLELIFPGGSLTNAERLYSDSPFARGANRLARAAVEAVLQALPAGRRLRVLELGAGTGGLTGHILPLLPADRTQFTFTDVAHHFLAKAREKFPGLPVRGIPPARHRAFTG